MIKNLRWTLVFLLLLVYMINYLDRVALSLTVPLIEQDLHLNAQQFGVILGSFFSLATLCSISSAGWLLIATDPKW